MDIYLLYIPDCDEVEYRLFSNRKHWAEADEDCRSRDGNLVVLDTHARVTSFQAKGILETGKTVWTAAYRQHSPWLWIEGMSQGKLKIIHF